MHTPSRPRPATPRVVVDEDEGQDEEIVVYPAPPHRADARTVERTDARARRWRSGELSRSQPAGEATLVEDTPSAATQPRTVPIHLVEQDRPRWRQTRPLGSPLDRPREALPPAGGPLEGNLMDPYTPLPARVNEANLTHDADGNPVFQVYRPEGSRFYAQDE